MRLEGSEQGDVAVVTRVCPSEQEFQRLPCACCVRSWSSGRRRGWMGVSGGALEPLERSEPCWGCGDGSWARQGWTQPGAVLCCGKVSACGVCLGKVSARVLSAPKGAPGVLQAQDGAGERPQASLGGLWGLTGSGRGGILLFQAIFAALGLCCLGGKDAGGGCCCCWQLLRSSAVGFPWLPNPKPVELSVCTDRGKPCCEGSSLEGSRKIPVLLLVSVGLFVSFLFFPSSFKRHVFL